MSPEQITKMVNRIVELLLENGGDFEKESGDTGVQIRSYSGRCMDGRECLAIVGTQDDCGRALADIIKQAAGDVINLASDENETEEQMKACSQAGGELDSLIDMLLKESRLDTMGRDDIVMYWPRLKYSAQDNARHLLKHEGKTEQEIDEELNNDSSKEEEESV